MSKKTMTKKSWLIIAAVLVVAAIVVMAITNKKDRPADGSAETPVTEQTEATTIATEPAASTPEQMYESVNDLEEKVPELVHVEMLNYELAFNAQLAEKVFYREIADTAEDDLQFYTKIKNQEYVIFTLVFNSVEGDIVHMIDGTEETKIPIAFQMSTLPEGLTAEDASEFYIVQGVVNEVVESIKIS